MTITVTPTPPTVPTKENPQIWATNSTGGVLVQMISPTQGTVLASNDPSLYRGFTQNTWSGMVVFPCKLVIESGY